MTAAQVWAAEKAVSTLRARCALAGAVLEVIEGDDGRRRYVLTRAHVTLQARSIAQAEHYLEQLAGIGV